MLACVSVFTITVTQKLVCNTLKKEQADPAESNVPVTAVTPNSLTQLHISIITTGPDLASH